MIAVYIIFALFAVLLAVVLIRALMFTPKKEEKCIREEVKFDHAAAIEALRQLVQCKTISYFDPSLEDNAEFEKLEDLLPELFKNVFKTCTLTKLPDRALLFKWSGKNSGDPAVLMAHYDVVPVSAENWQKPPFSVEIENGVMWGRGTLDTKVTFSGLLFAANTLIGQGFVPENDIYFAFSGGEEVNGKGAENIVNWFFDNGIKPALVVDEGGAVVEDVFPGVKRRCGMIGIAEKGMINLEFSTNSAGGHASAPAPHTPIGILSAGCEKIENSPFKMHITKPAKEMFDNLGRHSTFLYRIIFANLWLFSPVLDLIAKKGGGEINAILRTTVAFTQASGSDAPNVIPPKAAMVANLRLNPEDNVESALEYIRKTIKDERITLNVLGSMEPSPLSETDCQAYNKVANAVLATWDDALVSPYLMVQCSDSRHYRDLSNHVYRFSAMDMTKEERASIHGNNERIRLESILKAVEFFIRLIKQC